MYGGFRIFVIEMEEVTVTSTYMHTWHVILLRGYWYLSNSYIQGVISTYTDILTVDRSRQKFAK